MNIADLRDELDARSDPGGEPLGAVRLAAVHARVSGIRRRRIATTVAAIAVVCAAIVGYSLRPAAPPPNQPTVTHSATTINGFPEYANGGRVVTTASATLPVDKLVLDRVVMGPRGFTFSTRCEVPEDIELWLAWTANGRPLTGTSCSSPGGGYVTPLHFGIAAGTPVTFEVRVERAARIGGGSMAVAATGTLAVAVFERLAFEDYPLPPRPATLKPMTQENLASNMDPAGALAVIDSDPANPNAVRSLGVAVPADAQLYIVAQTPGSIEIRVDGTVISTGEWWTYDLGMYGVTLPAGHTVELRPAHMTGAWRAVIQRAS